MLTQNIGVHRARVYPVVATQERPKTRRIQQRARADNTLCGPIRQFLRHVRQHVDRIRRHNEHRIRRMLVKLGYDLFKDVDIALQELQARFARPFLAGSCRNHNELCIRHVGIAPRTGCHVANEHLAVHQVHGFALGTLMVDIREDDFAGQALIKQGIGSSLAYISDSDNANSTPLDHNRSGGGCEKAPSRVPSAVYPNAIYTQPVPHVSPERHFPKRFYTAEAMKKMVIANVMIITSPTVRAHPA